MPNDLHISSTDNVPQDAIARLVRDRFEHSRNAFTIYHQKCIRYYDLWHGWSIGGLHPFRNNVSIPLVFSVIMSDVARKMATSFGVRPWVSFAGGGPEDAPFARRTEALVSEQFDDSGTYLKAVNMFTSGDLYGNSPMQIGWRQDIEKVDIRQQAPSLTGQTLRSIITEDRVTFDGPDWEPIDILDHFPQPGVPRTEDMTWQIRRYWLDMDEVKALARQGVFDQAAVASLEAASIRERVLQSFTNRRGTRTSPMGDNDLKRLDKHAKPVELIEYWGTVPDDMKMPDDATRRVITLANRSIPLRNRPRPFNRIQSPIRTYSPLPDPHSFVGVGKAEIAEKMQFTANRFMNQKLDALDTFIDPFFVYDRNSGVDPRELYMRAGRVFGVDGDPARAVLPIFPNLQGLNAALTEIEQLWRWVQQGTGIIQDTVQGQGGPGNTTAREFLGRQEAVNTRLLLESRIAEESWIEPMARDFALLDQQFMEPGKLLRMLGADALVDPETGEPIPEQERRIHLDDLNRDYNVRANGTTQTLGKAQKTQNLMLLLQAAGSHPVGLQLVNWAAFFRQIFQSAELDDPDGLLTLTPAQRQAQTQAIAAASPQGDQATAPGTPDSVVDLASLVGLGQGGIEAPAGDIAGLLGG